MREKRISDIVSDIKVTSHNEDVIYVSSSILEIL